jgi:hypothetical protein
MSVRTPAFFALVALTFTLAACAAPAAEPTESAGEPTASPTVAATASPEPTLEPTASPTATPPPPGIGSQVKVEELQYVTVTAVEQWGGTDTQKPATDNVFVTVRIRIDAITTTSFASADFTLVDVDDMSYVYKTGRSPHLSYLDGLEPGHNYAGWVTFEVPADKADELVLVYSPTFVTQTYEILLY